MAEISIEIKEIIDRYINKLLVSDFEVTEVYLFGSHSRGTFTEFSDIDLAIISPNFDGNRLLDREKLLGFNRDIDTRISVLPLTTDSKNNSFFVEQEILQKGIRIY